MSEIFILDLFVQYFTATRDTCNTDARWKPCNAQKLYYQWMCARLRAENYPLLIDEGTLPCMENLYAYLPIFSDIRKYCAADAYKLGVKIGISIVTLLTYSLL